MRNDLEFRVPVRPHRTPQMSRDDKFSLLPAILRFACGASVFVATLMAVLALCAGCSKTEAPTPPPPGVTVTPVLQRDVPIYQEWVGTLAGEVNATISAQVSGYLVKRAYREGAIVKKGDVLLTLDPIDYQRDLGSEQDA